MPAPLFIWLFRNILGQNTDIEGGSSRSEGAGYLNTIYIDGKGVEDGHKKIESRTSQLATGMCMYFVLRFLQQAVVRTVQVLCLIYYLLCFVIGVDTVCR